MKKNNKTIIALLLGCALLLSACGGGQGNAAISNDAVATAGSAVQGNTNPATQPETAKAESSAEEIHAADPEESRVENTGSLSVITSVSDGFTVSGDVYTITKEGSYSFSGTAREGQIVVDAEEQKSRRSRSSLSGSR